VIDGKHSFKVGTIKYKKKEANIIYAEDNIMIGEENIVPLWLFGLLY
jgi:hypothetical protein